MSAAEGGAWYVHTCQHCGGQWCGLATCHCSGCHQTFANLTAFDAHRQAYKCVAPAAAGLVDMHRDYPCWGDLSHLSPRDRRRVSA
jgi:hypothetical protein